MEPSIISAVLLVGRLVAMSFLMTVAATQYRLLRSNVYPELQNLRATLFILTVVVMLSQVYPIVIDIYGIFDRATPGMIIFYAFSNNGSAVLTSIMLWTIYRIANRTGR